MHGSNHVLSADGTLVHAVPTLAACDHVSTLQQHTVNRRVHADLTQIFLLAAGLSWLSWVSWKNSNRCYAYIRKFNSVVNKKALII